MPVCRREEILAVLKKVYHCKKHRNVPIFYVTSKDLRDFTTTEKDMKKGVIRFPTPNYRTTEEDLFDENANLAPTPSMVSTTSDDTELWENANSGAADLQQYQAARGKQLSHDTT